MRTFTLIRVTGGAIGIATFLLLSACSWITNGVGRGTAGLYQVSPVVTSNNDTKPNKKNNYKPKNTPSGIALPINLDTYQLIVCDGSDFDVAKVDEKGNLTNCKPVFAYQAAVRDGTGEARNRLRSALVKRSDLICSQTQAQIVGSNDLLNFSLAEVTTVLAGAGAIVTGATAAKILSGSAAATNATRTQMNEVFYQNAIKSAIIQKMNDIRVAQLAHLNKLSFTGDADSSPPTALKLYSTEAMLNDVLDYHNKCSFYSGVTNLTQTASSATPTLGATSNPVPTLTKIDPNSGTASAAGGVATTVQVTLTGTGFTAASTLTISGAGVSHDKLAPSSDGTTIKTTFTITPGAEKSARNISVTNPAPGGGTSATMTFTVN